MYQCPECGQPVVAVAKRHKTLGAYVPLWEPGPCRNPDCPLYVPPESADGPPEGRHGPAEERDSGSTTPDDPPGREAGTS